MSSRAVTGITANDGTMTDHVGTFRGFIVVRDSTTLQRMTKRCTCSSDRSGIRRLALHSKNRRVGRRLRRGLGRQLTVTKVRIIRTHVGCLTCTPRVTTIVLHHRRTSTVVDTERGVMRKTISVMGVTLRGLSRRRVIRLSRSGGTTVIDGLLIMLYTSRTTRPMMGAKALGRWSR